MKDTEHCNTEHCNDNRNGDVSLYHCTGFPVPKLWNGRVNKSNIDTKDQAREIKGVSINRAPCCPVAN